jgi:hypothetical protein
MEEIKVEEKSAQLPLDLPRQVTLKSKAGVFTYTLRRVLDADWRVFFSSIIHQTLQVDGRREEVFESDSGLVELVDRVLLSVDGYGDLSAIKDWKQALPFKHRIAVGMVLRSVIAMPSAETAQLCDLVEVKLDATWPADGKAMEYSGLVHRFRHPSIEQLKRFNFEASRIRVRGTSQDGVSSYPSKQAIAMKIYDDLIDSVDGYSVAGVALVGVEQIKKEMDGAHKSAAALHLFMGESDVEVE